jgi:hypothetical protein
VASRELDAGEIEKGTGSRAIWLDGVRKYISLGVPVLGPELAEERNRGVSDRRRHIRGLN